MNISVLEVLLSLAKIAYDYFGFLIFFGAIAWLYIPLLQARISEGVSSRPNVWHEENEIVNPRFPFSGIINPATGEPMVNEPVDISGNPWGAC